MSAIWWILAGWGVWLILLIVLAEVLCRSSNSST